MGNVFVSYRRAETAGEARALFKDLTAALGHDAVFMDVDTIALGRDFREILRERLESSDMVLALIGRDWVTIEDAAGRRRLEDPDDFIRLELEIALRRGVPVIPVLVQGAQMPAIEQLPEPIRDLTFRNAFEISHSRWESDVRELLRRLGLDRPETGGGVPQGGVARRKVMSRRISVAVGLGLLAGVIGGGAYVYRSTTTIEADRAPRSEYQVVGAIREKWATEGGERSALGVPLGNEVPTFDGVGRSQQFHGGLISWHPRTGAHVVQGKIAERWLAIGREQFGYPVTDEVPKPDGRGRGGEFKAVHLPNEPVASIYWLPETGAQEVFGAIRDRWIEMGAERGAMGYPVSPEHDEGGGRIQQFQHGSLFWTAQGGVVVK